MAKKLTYADAVSLLGATDSKVVDALDKLAGGLLLALTGGGSELALALFDAKGEFARLSNSLVSSLRSKLQGTSRYDRTERIAAAHAIIMIAAYFEGMRTFDEQLGDFERLVVSEYGESMRSANPTDDVALVVSDTRQILDRVRKWKLSKSQQVAFTTAWDMEKSHRLRPIVEQLLRSELPIPTPQRSYEQSRQEIREFYEKLSTRTPEFAAGSELWNSLNDSPRRLLQEIFRAKVPDYAITHYEAAFLRLAGDFPEVSFWVNNLSHQATRSEIRDLKVGLAGLERVLNKIAEGRNPDDKRAALARYYRSRLERPIVETGEVAAQELRIPTLDDAYINPDYRVADVRSDASIHIESWWNKFPVRSDLQEFLLGYLTGKQATEAPLVILGHPGSGKSVLTKILAARLPARDFLAIRVVLREVPADADFQTQIEYSIRDATGESASWTDIVQAAGDALPVVLLDGFDELLQATGVSQSDYLEKVVSFQEREAVHERHVAVLVTSRTVVADRARIPASGAVALRLEHFSAEQSKRWIAAWNASNSQYWINNDLQPLSAERVLVHKELAAQPLLLLMLALYDADGNPLQGADGKLSRAQLYEKLIARFAQREVKKTRSDLDDDAIQEDVNYEMLRLSVAAFAMFNRNRQWVTQRELDDDLNALVSKNARTQDEVTFRSSLSAAQIVMGRFFFVHEAQAILGDQRFTTCEFLHATFGEFLISHLLYKELNDIAKTVEMNAGRTRKTPPDDAFIYALLSFSPLSLRATTLDFLDELFDELTLERRKVLRELLIGLFRVALDGRATTSYQEYLPARLQVTERCASYSANLLSIILILEESVSVTDLFEATEPVAQWRRYALLWRSQLSPESWTWLASNIQVDRSGAGNERNLVISRPSRQISAREVDPLWVVRAHQSGTRFAMTTGRYLNFRLESQFICDEQDDALSHALEPFSGALGSALTTYVNDGIRTTSIARALIKLWIASSGGGDVQELTSAYDACFEIMFHGFEIQDKESRSRFQAIILHQLSVDRNRLPGVWREEVRELFKGMLSTDPEWTDWSERVIVKLGFNPRKE